MNFLLLFQLADGNLRQNASSWAMFTTPSTRKVIHGGKQRCGQRHTKEAGEDSDRFGKRHECHVSETHGTKQVNPLGSEFSSGYRTHSQTDERWRVSHNGLLHRPFDC